MELLDNYHGNADLPAHVSVPGYIPSTISCPPHAAATATDTGVAVAASKGKQAARRENCKKRKTDQSQNPKVVAEEDSKSTTSGSTITNNKNSKAPSGNASKVSDVPKPDYIHVRARRGQATDSHSLAERVRREKISERMRYLQDLVPGCNRITGKAGMLDEIINYVQSLQRQVEFLSMKLASIDTMPEFDVDGYLAKEMFQACPSSLPAIGASTHMVNPANIQFNAFGNGATDLSIEMGVNHPIDVAIRRTISAPVSFPDTFLDSPSLNHMTWEDELQNLYGVAYQQQRSTPYLSQPFTGFNGAGNVKLEM